MSFYPSPYHLLFHLKDGQWVKGPELAEKFGITRAAIWKQVQQLQAKGIGIEHGHRGYRLADSLILLDEKTIKKGIALKKSDKTIRLQISACVDSTNQLVKYHNNKDGWTICLAEQQTRGRGRLGRDWASPFGENMYLSIAWRTSESLAKLSGLSIATSLALKDALSPWIDDLQVKWPNDLLWQGKKMAGCLIEVNAESHGNSFIIVGIGLNINTLTDKHPLSDHPHCSMRDILQCYLNRNEIIIAIINRCLQSFETFDQQGLSPLLKSWREADYLYNQLITIYQPSQTVDGIAKGINASGHLLIETKQGFIKEISSGEASLKKTRTKI